jgi:hypothetical protein
MKLTKMQLCQFFPLGWHNNHDNIIWLRETALELYAELEKAETELADIRDAHIRVMSEQCPTDEIHCTCVPTLRRELAELQERIEHCPICSEKCRG